VTGVIGKDGFVSKTHGVERESIMLIATMAVLRAEQKRRRPRVLDWSQLTDVLVAELVTESDSLRLMLNGLAVHDRYFELLDNSPMDRIALRGVELSSLVC